MPIEIRLDVMLALRRPGPRTWPRPSASPNRTCRCSSRGKVKGIRLATLEAICAYLACQPGDLLEYLPGPTEG